VSRLVDRRCSACAPGTPALRDEQREVLGKEVPAWSVVDGTRIRREYRFKTYLDGARWVPLVGEIADSEDHHPDLHLFFKKVVIELWTHTVNGLSENDYIVAAKFDQAYEVYPGKR
jgi:4a-hydroxytetrahydrobiopterin dehydratase